MTAPQKTSIIMVSYHTGPVLDHAINQVLAQDAPFELILVNNGNPPEIEEELIRRFKDDPHVRLMTGHGNIGFGRACNLGARMASGDFLLFLNPDSLLPEQAVSHLREISVGLESPFMIGARLLDGDGHDQRGCRRALLTPKTALVEALHLSRFFPNMRLNYHERPMPETLTPMPAISGAFMYLSAKDFHLIKGFDERFFLHVEDLDFCLRFRQAGGEIYFDPFLIVTHVGSTSKVTNLFLEKQKAIGFIGYFKRNYGNHASPLLLWLLEKAIWTRYGLKVFSSFLRFGR